MLYLGKPPSSEERQRSSAYLVPAALRDLGYVEGRNVVIERRHAEDKAERLAPLARELAQLRVDVVFAVCLSAVRAAKEASATIPIVLYGNFDPVASGIVTSLARPGGNVTGVLIAPEGTLASKKLELLRETAPKAARLALLAPADPGFARQLREVQAPASRDLRLARAGGGRRPHGLRHQPCGARQAHRELCRPDLQGGQGRRAAHRAAHPVRAGDQPQDREGARAGDSAIAAAACRSHHRLSLD
jgi:hypothetical protein